MCALRRRQVDVKAFGVDCHHSTHHTARGPLHRASTPRGWSRSYLGWQCQCMRPRPWSTGSAHRCLSNLGTPAQVLAGNGGIGGSHSRSRAATAWRGGGGGRGGVDGEGRGHAWPLATSTGPRRAAPHHPCGLVAGGLPTAGLRHACYTRPYASSACVLPQHSPLPRTVLAHNKNGHAKQPFPMTPGPSDQWAPCKAPTDQWAPLQGARRPGCPARRPLAQSQG